MERATARDLEVKVTAIFAGLFFPRGPIHYDRRRPRICFHAGGRM